MNGIDELKANSEQQRMDMTDMSLSAGRHTIVRPNNNDMSMSNREEIDLTSMQKPEVDENIHESLTKDILEGENSIFEKYKKEKIEEFNERMATFDQERELAEIEKEEAEDEKENNFFGMELSSSLNNTGNTMTTENVRVVEENVSKFSDTSLDEDVEEEQSYEEDKSEVTEITTDNIDDVSVQTVENEVAEETPDILDDISDSGNSISEDEVLENLQKLATEKIKPIARSLDLSSYTVMKKPTASIKALENTEVKAAKWVLPTQNSTILMKEFLGSELENLREYSEDSQNLSLLYRKYRSIYDHIVSPKPANYETWLKTTPYSDADHYFFAAYIASFKGVNYLPLDCTNDKCKKTFLTDDIPILDMVKFKNDKAKEEFTKLYTSENNYAGSGLYVSSIIPLNNKLAVGFKDASIYSLFEILTLSQSDKEKYASIIEFIPYIDSLYIIHQDTQNLEPIGYKIFPENATKTIRSKINVFYNALKTLTVDEFTPIKSFIRNIADRTEGFNYIYPEIKCPDCGTLIKEEPTSGEQLLFVRYQLGALANTSLK